MSQEVSSNTNDDKPFWIPLESDPEIMTEYLQLLSLTGHYLVDIPLLDEAEEMGIFQANNVVAYIFLYEITPNSEADLVGNYEMDEKVLKNLYFMRQTAKNACGSVALFHSYLNTILPEQIEPESVIGKFRLATLEKSPAERAELFESNSIIAEHHRKAATQGQSDVPSGEKLDNIDYHYVSLVYHNGFMLELDGRRPSPINHGPVEKEKFKTEVLGVIKKLMQRDPNNLHYSILALAEPQK